MLTTSRRAGALLVPHSSRQNMSRLPLRATIETIGRIRDLPYGSRSVEDSVSYVWRPNRRSTGWRNLSVVTVRTVHWRISQWCRGERSLPLLPAWPSPALHQDQHCPMSASHGWRLASGRSNLSISIRARGGQVPSGATGAMSMIPYGP